MTLENTAASPAVDVAKLAPTAGGDRIQLLDTLRGLAILGILLINVHVMGWPIYYELFPALHSQAPWDLAAEALKTFFVENKFYTLFSFLFGLGMAIQLERHRASGRAFTPFFVKRLLILAAFGLVHGVFVWSGDILLIYALLGFPLLLFQRARQGWLLAWAALAILSPMAMNTLIIGAVELLTVFPDVREPLDAAVAQQSQALRQSLDLALRAYGSGSYLEATAQRLRDLAFILGNILSYAGLIGGSFLLGVWAWRKGLLREPERHRRFFRRALWIGLPLGLLGNAFYTWVKMTQGMMTLNLATLFGGYGMVVGQYALCLVYVAAVVELARRGAAAGLRAKLDAVGRMALSNYLFQSVAMTLIFYGYGLGFIGGLDAAACTALALALYLVQVWLSQWWMGRFRFGPMEWLWRSLTYGRPQPMKR